MTMTENIAIPTANNSLTKAQREHFVHTQCGNRVKAMLNQPFGEENLNQCFCAEPHFCHVLTPLWKSGFTLNDPPGGTNPSAFEASTWSDLGKVLAEVGTLLKILQEHGDIDFNSLRGHQKNWDQETATDKGRASKATAVLLHFNGNAATLVCWIGGPHVGQHRNLDAILGFMVGKADESIIAHVVHFL